MEWFNEFLASLRSSIDSFLKVGEQVYSFIQQYAIAILLYGGGWLLLSFITYLCLKLHANRKEIRLTKIEKFALLALWPFSTIGYVKRNIFTTEISKSNSLEAEGLEVEESKPDKVKLPISINFISLTCGVTSCMAFIYLSIMLLFSLVFFPELGGFSGSFKQNILQLKTVALFSSLLLILFFAAILLRKGSRLGWQVIFGIIIAKFISLNLILVAERFYTSSLGEYLLGNSLTKLTTGLGSVLFYFILLEIFLLFILMSPKCKDYCGINSMPNRCWYAECGSLVVVFTFIFTSLRC